MYHNSLRFIDRLNETCFWLQRYPRLITIASPCCNKKPKFSLIAILVFNDTKHELLAGFKYLISECNESLVRLKNDCKFFFLNLNSFINYEYPYFVAIMEAKL